MLSILDRYRKYGKHVNWFRALPGINDGLRPAERRALVGGYKAAKEMVKSVKIVAAGLVLHPHGDASFYDTLARLVNAGYFDKQGNWGSTEGLTPQTAAAMRYTEARLNSFYKNMIFEFIHDVPWEEIEIEEEPLFLPTPVPLCFLLDNVNIGIGFGIKTVIPRYKLNDLISLTKSIVVDRKPIVIKPYCPGNIVLKESEVEQLLDSGEGRIVFQTRYRINENNRNIKIYGTPVGGFSSLLSMLENRYFKDGSVSFNDHSEGGKVELEVSVIKNKRCDFTKLCKDVIHEITKPINCKILVNDKNAVRCIGVKEFLIHTLNNYMETYHHRLETDHRKIEDKLYEFRLIEKVRPFIGEYLKQKIYDIEFIVSDILNNIDNLDEKVLRDLMKKYSIEKLFTVSIDVEKLKEEMGMIKYKINNINAVTLEKYLSFFRPEDE